MSGIMGLLDIAKRALAASQVGMEVVSNNIANVNTPGYSRQIVNYETSPALNMPYGPLGYGVQVAGIGMAFDPFVAARLAENTSQEADYESQKAYLDQVASLFNETLDGGISQLLSGFWDAVQDLSDNPSGSGERQTLLGQAQTLADAFNFRADQLVQLRNDITQQIGPTIEEINTHAARIAELNGEILAIETPEHQANNLRDERQMELNELSALVGVRYYTTGDGTINVTLPNGTPLVQSMTSFELDYQITSNDKVQVNWLGPGGVTEDVTAAITGGELHAQLEVRDTQIPQFQQDLDNLAQELIAAVNTQHSQGVGLEMFTEVTSTYFVDGPNNLLYNNPSLPFGDRITTSPNPSQFTIHVENSSNGLSSSTIIPIDYNSTTLENLRSQLDAVTGISASIVSSGSEYRLEITSDDPSIYSFGFSGDNSNVLMALGLNTFFTGDSAYSLGVNDTVKNDYNFIAAGQIEQIDVNTIAHASGDNRNALALADLADQKIANLGNLTVGDAYGQLVTDIGLAAEEAGSQEEYYQGMVDQYSQLRDSVSGVSLDEELANLIKYQRAYQAAAQMISAADEMFQALLGIKQ